MSALLFWLRFSSFDFVQFAQLVFGSARIAALDDAVVENIHSTKKLYLGER
jgi:hypothetical protein